MTPAPFADSWASEIDAPPLETPRQLSARAWLAGQPAWALTRASLSEGLRSLDGVSFAAAQAQAIALGLWKAAQADLSWVAETFLLGAQSPPSSRPEFSSLNLVDRACAFERFGFPWAELGPRALALAARVASEGLRMQPKAFFTRFHPDGGEIKGDSAHTLIGLCAQALLFPLGVAPETAKKMAFSPHPFLPCEPIEIACAAAAARGFAAMDPDNKKHAIRSFCSIAAHRARSHGAFISDEQAAALLEARLVNAIEIEAAFREKAQLAAAASEGAALSSAHSSAHLAAPPLASAKGVRRPRASRRV